MRVTWDPTAERYFQHGVDRGVLYGAPFGAVAFNGITGVEESGNGSSTAYYIDGRIFVVENDATDFEGKLTAWFFPDEFGACVGMPEIVDGLILDNQRPKPFGLSYRSLIGSGTEGDMFGYQIHLIYNATASIGTRSRKTLSDSPAPIEFSFDITATPEPLAGYRPTAHYIIDTRNLDPDTITDLETLLYGTSVVNGALPDPIDLFEMLNFGVAIQVTSITADKTINIKGSRANVYLTSSTEYKVDNINLTGVINPDGTYVISDGGNTTVTIV